MKFLNENQWKRFVDAIFGNNKKVTVALIIDSPWIPGYCNLSHFDYYLFPEPWFKANLKITSSFPNIIFVPGFWVEYGLSLIHI